VVAVNLLIGCVFGSIDVSVVAAATEWGVRSAAGTVLAVFSFASGVAGFYYGSRAWHSPLTGRFVIGVVALFVCALGLLFAHTELLLAGVGLLVGATVAPTLINGNTLLERMVARERLTEGLSWMGTGLGIGVAVGSGIAGPVIDANGYAGGFVVTVCCAGVAALIAVSSLPFLRRTVPHVVVVDGASDRIGE
jgi:MFS family permease